MIVNKKFYTYFLYFRQIMIISVQIITAISAIAAIFLLTTSNEDLFAVYHMQYGPFKLRHVIAIDRHAERSVYEDTQFCDSPVMRYFNQFFENALYYYLPDTIVHSYYRYLSANNSEAKNYCLNGLLKYELDITDFHTSFGVNLLSQAAKISQITSQIHDLLRYTTPEQFDVHYYSYAEELRQDRQTIELLFTAIFFVPAIYIIYIKNKMNFLLVSLLSWANSFIIGTAVVFFAYLFTKSFNFRSVLTCTIVTSIVHQLLFAKRFETTFHLNRLYFEQQENAQLEVIERNYQLEQQNQLLKSIQMGITIPRTQQTNYAYIAQLQYETIIKTSYNFFNNMLSTETILLCCYVALFGLLALIPNYQFAYIALFGGIQCIVCYGINFLNTNAMVLVCENIFFRSHNVFRDKFTAKSTYEVLIQQDELDDDLPVTPYQPINQLLDFIKELSDEENYGEYLDQIEDAGSDIMEERERQKLLYKEIVGSSQSKLAKVLNVKIAMRQIQAYRFARIIIYVVYGFAIFINVFCLINMYFGVDFSYLQQHDANTKDKQLFAQTYHATDIFPVEFDVHLSRYIDTNVDLDRLYLATMQMFDWTSFYAPYFLDRFYYFTDINRIRNASMNGTATPEEIRVITFYDELGGGLSGLHHFRCRLHFNQSVTGSDFREAMSYLAQTLPLINKYLQIGGANFNATFDIASIQAVISDNYLLQNSCFWGYGLFVSVALYVILSFAHRSFIAGIKFLLCAFFLYSSGMAAIYIIFQLFYADPPLIAVSLQYILLIIAFVLQCEFDVKMRDCGELNRASMTVASTISFDIALVVSSFALFITMLKYFNILGFGLMSLAFVYAIYVCPYLYTALSVTFRKKK